LHLHRLRYPYNLEGTAGPDADSAINVITGETKDENYGSDCRLCGNFVHMDTWTLYYIKWLREQRLPLPPDLQGVRLPPYLEVGE